MRHTPRPSDEAPDKPQPAIRADTLLARLRRAFGRPAPGGASSTPSPTQGRTSGVSAPGEAETVRRQGTPDQEAGAGGGPDRAELYAAQRRLLRHAGSAATGVQPTIRRFTGDKRTVRVGPLRFTAGEDARLQEAAAEHGYKGGSGFAADVVLAFLTGHFTANLPLSEDRRRTHHFRAQVLRQLNRIGVNVNQIARALNNDRTPRDLRQGLDELQHLLELIAASLREPADATEVRDR